MKKNLPENIVLFSTRAPDKHQESETVMVERRRLLWLPVAVFTAMAFGFPKMSSAKTRLVAVDEAGIGWDDFIKQCVPTAQELHKDSSVKGQDAYLYWLATMAVRLKAETMPPAKLFKFGDSNPPIEMGVGYKGVPFFIVEWRMSPNAFLPPHCHPNASVCTLGIEGETRIRNFQIVGESPEFSSNKSFKVRETHNEIISAGRVNTLSATRDNIHTFQVGKSGARGIDISTYHGPDVGFSFLDIKDKTPAEGSIFEAVWTKV